MAVEAPRLSRPRLVLFFVPEGETSKTPAFTRLIRWLVMLMRVFGLHPSATPPNVVVLGEGRQKTRGNCPGPFGCVSGGGLVFWLLAIAANVYGGVLFWGALITSVENTGIFSPLSAWQLLCTLLHTMSAINLAFAILAVRGQHELLSSLNSIRLRHMRGMRLLTTAVMGGAIVLTLLALCIILALIFCSTAVAAAEATVAPSTQDPKPSSTTSPHDNADATASTAPGGGPGFFWLVFQIWLTLSIFLSNLLPAAYFVTICAFLKEAFRQNHADFLTLHSPNITDIRQVKAEFFRLTRLLATANGIFAYKVIVNVGCAVGGFCFAVYHLVKAAQLGAEEYGGAGMEMIVQSLVISIIFVLVFIFAAYMIASAYANEESRAIKDSLLEQECDDGPMKYCIDRFIQKCETREWGLSVAKFFLIDRAAFLTAVSVIFTFLVVWVQLSQTEPSASSEVGFACNCHCPSAGPPTSLFNHSALIPFTAGKKM